MDTPLHQPIEDRHLSGKNSPSGPMPVDLLAQWLDEHGDALYCFAMQKVRDEHVVADLLQETFLAAYEGFQKFRGDAQVRTWLISILRIKILDFHRRQKRHAKMLQHAPDRSRAASFRSKALEAWPTDTDQLDHSEFWLVFTSCIEKLPSTLAKAFMLRELDGHDTTHVCSILNISPKNLAVRLYRARASLRDCLDGNWFAEE